MNIAGCCDDGFNDLDDVELVSLDPILEPLPECLNDLNSFPVRVDGLAGAVDYSSESKFQLPCSRKWMYLSLHTMRVSNFLG